MIQPELFVHLSYTEGDVNQTTRASSNDQWQNVKDSAIRETPLLSYNRFYFSTLDTSDDSTNVVDAGSDCERKWIREMDHVVHSLPLFLTFLRQL